MPTKEPSDSLTLAGAEKLAEQLTAWWHERGHTHVQHWVERSKRGDSEKGIYVVRSNLINGMPPPGGAIS